MKNINDIVIDYVIKNYSTENIALKLVDQDNNPIDISDFFLEDGRFFAKYRKFGDKDWSRDLNFTLVNGPNGQLIWNISNLLSKELNCIIEVEFVGVKGLVYNADLDKWQVVDDTTKITRAPKVFGKADFFYIDFRKSSGSISDFDPI